MAFILSFDIGYASIGWCVLKSLGEHNADPAFLGTGVVTFPSDDCLASQRRVLRRTRRHIRSTRQRIERMKLLLANRGFLSRQELDEPGHPAPFLLAAAAIHGHRMLSAKELWSVIRWYAHNRGYDGNSLWSRGEDEGGEDTEKETNAKSLMAQHGMRTMCETVCACLGLDPAASGKRISSSSPYKTLNAAYPRAVVRNEVSELLARHATLFGPESSTVRLLLKQEALNPDERKQLAEAGIRLPLRYHGGLLFGQLVPRFDNRIISRCPITWAKTYDEALAAGKAEAEARKLAEKFSKVPAARCVDFLEYRFARVLANLKVDGVPIGPEARKQLFELGKAQGSLTPTDLRKSLASIYPGAKTNVSDYFTLHPDSAKQLVLDPVADAARKAAGKASKLYAIWDKLSNAVREEIKMRWSRNRSVALAEILEMAADDGSLASLLQPAFEKMNKPKNGRSKFADFSQFLIRTTTAPEFPTGRAPYARPVLKQVVAEVLSGFDPTKPASRTAASEGEDKASDGVLYALQNPGSRVNELRAERPLDSLTNNHLVRHRMLILERLVEDLAAEFDIPEDPRIVVEVARELKEFSGKDSQAIKQALNEKLKDFKAAVTYLEKHAPDLPLSGSLIRKARIAMDMGWQCPFTGDIYDAYALPRLEREHIIPYSTRNSNALHAIVLTWPEVNRMKGKRSALQFIDEDGGKPVANRANLSLLTRKPYEDLVGKLKVTGHDDDRRRQKARKALLLTTNLEEKDLGFTDGQLTQTSQLMKLATRGLKRRFPKALVDPIPGPVTAEIRKGWRLTGTLSMACPEVLIQNETDEKGHPRVRPKDEIRGLTHLHHALDAATLALIAHYFPLQKHGHDQKGTLWKAILKRGKSDEDIRLLTTTGQYKRTQRLRPLPGGGSQNQPDAELTDLPSPVKQALARSLAQGRVMQHIPADRSGVKAELTTWGIVSIDGEDDGARVNLRQRTSSVVDGKRQIQVKTREERAGKLLGTHPVGGNGKLKSIKGAMIIGENYGLALDPEPEVIPFHNVHQRLAVLHARNSGKPVRVLRNGMLIRSTLLGEGTVWQVRSIKQSKRDGILLDLAWPQMVPTQAAGRPWSKRDASVKSLMKGELEILPSRYCGHTGD